MELNDLRNMRNDISRLHGFLLQRNGNCSAWLKRDVSKTIKELSLQVLQANVQVNLMEAGEVDIIRSSVLNISRLYS